MPERVVIVGGGVGGLSAALALGRAGHQVTLLERDPLPATADAEEAFVAERRGAPQVHQTHGFLARIRVELRERFPDVLDALHEVGGVTFPMTSDLGAPQPGDEDLAVLIVRRTTFEWVLRKAVVAEPAVTIRTDVAVAGLEGAGGAVTGVRLASGEVVAADAVVAATGRRSDVPAWLAAVGVEIDETIVESGLMYLSRWYRFLDGAPVELDPKLGGDLGFAKYLAVPGDGDTLSITLAIRPDDADLRKALSSDDGFEEACRMLPGPNQFVGKHRLDPVGGVRPMGGLLNRLRRFTDADGAPLVRGFHAIGDAHTCTNPLYGRGCSLALVQAGLLADALAAHPGDAEARARTYEASCAAEVEPWFRVSVDMDKAGSDPANPVPTDSPASRGLAAVFVAGATDPVIGRALFRFMNLLAKPTDLMADAALMARMAEVMANPEKYPIPPREGPSRSELLAALAA